MAETKDYNPKTASVTDVYMVDDDGYTRWFIPMLAPEAPMAEQLAQCQVLSPHGEARDEHPDEPLIVTSYGSVDGSLRLGQTSVGTAATFEGGAQPYTITVQFSQSPNGTNNWSGISSQVVPDENGQSMRMNSVNNANMFYRLKTTCTDKDGTVQTATSTVHGPVIAPDATLASPNSPIDQTKSTSRDYVWLGGGEYSQSMQAAYMNGEGVWTAMTLEEDYSTVINNAFPGSNLLVVRADASSNNLSIKVTTSGATGTSALQIKGQCTDTYSSLDNTAQKGIVVNFT